MKKSEKQILMRENEGCLRFVCFQFKSSGKQIRLISIFFLSQQSFSRMIAFIRLAMGMNNTHRKFLVVLTEEILCQSDRITNSVFPYATTL